MLDFRLKPCPGGLPFGLAGCSGFHCVSGGGQFPSRDLLLSIGLLEGLPGIFELVGQLLNTFAGGGGRSNRVLEFGLDLFEFGGLPVESVVEFGDG